MTVTTDPSPADIAARWRDQEAAVRAQWGEPGVIPLATMKTMSGMEIFAAIRDGRLPTPPIGRLLDFIAIEFEPGRMVFQGTPRKDHYNPLGSVHGGYAATLLDSCVGCAIHTMLPAGKGLHDAGAEDQLPPRDDRPNGTGAGRGQDDLGRRPGRHGRGSAHRQYRQAARIRDDDVPGVPDLSAIGDHAAISSRLTSQRQIT